MVPPGIGRVLSAQIAVLGAGWPQKGPQMPSPEVATKVVVPTTSIGSTNLSALA